MRFDPCSLTSETLLGRLRQGPDDQAAWDRFVERYGPMIYGWCRQWRLKKPTPRTWRRRSSCSWPGSCARLRLRPVAELPRLAAHADRARLQRLLRRAGAAGSRQRRHGRARSPQAAPGRADLLARLEEQFDYELMGEVLARVRLRVEPQTWEAFRLTATEGLPGDAAAARLGIEASRPSSRRKAECSSSCATKSRGWSKAACRPDQP